MYCLLLCDQRFALKGDAYTFVLKLVETTVQSLLANAE